MCSQLVSGFGGRAEALLCSGAGGWRLGVATVRPLAAAMGSVLSFADYLKVCFLIVLLCYLKAFAVCRTLDRMRLCWHLLEVDRNLAYASVPHTKRCVASAMPLAAAMSGALHFATYSQLFCNLKAR